MYFSTRFKGKKVLSLLALFVVVFAFFAYSGEAAYAASPSHRLSLKSKIKQSSNGGYDVHPGDALVLGFYYPTCDASCGNEAWFANNIPPNTTSTFNPSVTTLNNITTWTLQTTPLGTFTITIGATSDAGVNLGTLDLIVNIVSHLISNVTLSVTPTTPIWQVDFDISLYSSFIACPASLQLFVQSLTATINDVCGGNPTAPSDAHVLLSVFDPANPSNNLTPNSNETATAQITDQNQQDVLSVTVFVPPAPVWVGVGDSYSSGHHQLAEHRKCITEINPVCQVIPNDPVFSWVTRVVALLNSKLNVPTQWQMTANVLAISGSTTNQIVSNQVPTMETQLTNHHGSWNVVSMDGGANDADFVGQLVNFYLANLTNNLHAWNITDPTKCVNTEAIYQNLQQQTGTIVNNLNLIVADAVLVDQNVRVVDVDYPYVMNTNNICSKDHYVKQGKKMVFVHGAKTVVDGLFNLHNQITGSSIIHIDLRTGFGTFPLNDLQLIELYGYPHPNDTGQQAIAGLVVNSIH